jgi:Actin like proteins N terminal domain
MSETPVIIAIDPGFGNTKGYFNGKFSMIPSIVTRPKSIGNAGIGLKSALPLTEVSFDRSRFALGISALEWGTPLGSMDYLAFVSPEKQALLYAVLAELMTEPAQTIDSLVVGLPVELLKDELQSGQILGDLKSLKGKHSFSVNQKNYEVSIDRVKVMPQPLGAYADWLIGEDLRPRMNAAQADVAIIDIGMNTLDLYALTAGRPEPRFVAGAKTGVRRLFEILNRDGMDLSELDAAYRGGKLKLPEAALNSWLGEIMAQIELVMPKLSRFTAVIPSGGGALILSDLLRHTLIKKGAAVAWPVDPITANVRGLWKWAAYGARH